MSLFLNNKDIIKFSLITTSIYFFLNYIKNKPFKNLNNIKFIKYQGLGNDFILIDNRKSNELLISSQRSIDICNRHYGIGADGIIFLCKGSNNCKYSMKMYNANGSIAEMCGNGIRCLAKFIHEEIENNDTNNEKIYKIWTDAGEIIPQILSNGMIIVDMGEPILIANKIPTLLKSNNDNKVINIPLQIKDKIYYINACSMGNPHGIIFVDNLNTMDPSISVIGPIIENHEVFPEKANIEFVQIISKSHVLMKVWERGAGLTLACGTGSCATVVAGVLNNLINRRCIVTLPGGDLDINWNEDNNKVYMTGNAVYVYRGII